MDLTIRNLSKTYGSLQALNDVSLVIPRGMFGLLGPNGAGKSTLMRILATLQEADSGSVTLGETDVLRQKDEVRSMLGYLPQEFGLYPKVEAEELLEHFALLKGIANVRQRRETVRALLEQTNLYDARKKKVGGFSGGMRQRFGIAVALIGNPRLIIVDEPTAGLDPAERVRFLNLLSELGENAVVILSTHIVEDVSELCSRMAIINRGRILLEAEPLVAVERLRGRVWRRTVDKADLPAVEARHRVISTKLLAGRTVVHVIAAERPGPEFDAVEPDLEDVYFATMLGVVRNAPAAPPAPVPDEIVALSGVDRAAILPIHTQPAPAPDTLASAGNVDARVSAETVDPSASDENAEDRASDESVAAPASPVTPAAPPREEIILASASPETAQSGDADAAIPSPGEAVDAAAAHLPIPQHVADAVDAQNAAPGDADPPMRAPVVPPVADPPPVLPPDAAQAIPPTEDAGPAHVIPSELAAPPAAASAEDDGQFALPWLDAWETATVADVASPDAPSADASTTEDASAEAASPGTGSTEHASAGAAPDDDAAADVGRMESVDAAEIDEREERR
ncbi:MAG TPA: ATP-binding cassette domain-containing protein [Longimicrobiaceae bacterium]|jgi:ABC-type multidrug transport system ATPase subunit|nr:ATP-binding cassette domain-containing protein [Longimicrobiaceae bacterium]